MSATSTAGATRSIGQRAPCAPVPFAPHPRAQTRMIDRSHFLRPTGVPRMIMSQATPHVMYRYSDARHGVTIRGRSRSSDSTSYGTRPEYGLGWYLLCYSVPGRGGPMSYY